MKGFYYMCCTVDGKIFFARGSGNNWTWVQREIATVFDSVDSDYAKQCKKAFRRMKDGYIKGFISTNVAKG